MFTLRDLSAEITYLRKELSLSTKEHLVIEKLKLFTDLLIWGDKNDPSFFQYLLLTQLLSVEQVH